MLNDWAATELKARAGDTVTMEYYAWEEPGRLVTKTTTLNVAGVVPIDRGDRKMAPTYPGITDSPTLDDWDPPFPVDLRRIRKVDEQYWEKYRTTPKAFVALQTGQQLWQTRYGSMTAIRVRPGEGQSLARGARRLVERLRAAADPLALGLAVIDVRAQGLEASRGATDFGEYFVYFSFFIVVSALLLVALFFKLGIEQRVREVGLLRAVGFGPAQVRRLFLQEGILLAVAGSVLGIGGALGYAWLMMYGLRSWWVDAVGTTALTLHVSPASLVGGAIGGVVAAVGCIWWTLRALSRISERSLLMGTLDNSQLSNSQLPMSARALEVADCDGDARHPRVAAAGRCDDRLRRARGRVLRCRLGSVAGVAVRGDLAASGVARAAESRVTAGSRCRGWGCERRPIVPAAACCRSPSSHLRRSS